MAWVGGLAEWTEGDTAYLSVAFTWKLDEAYTRAVWFKAMGYKVRVGGPALFLEKPRRGLEKIAEIGGNYPDAVRHHNPEATVASRGCPVGCWFCIVPKMEGKAFTFLPDFPVRPVLCDNNLSALPADYQDYIISRYIETGTPLADANSGFEPQTFTPAVYARWKKINRGPWRFALDERKESKLVVEVLKMLKNEPQNKKRVYVLIGNEPYADCMARIRTVIYNGGEPHVQPFIKLNATGRIPAVRHDWNPQLLTDVARWANRWVWRKTPNFEDYRRSVKTRDQEIYDVQQGLFM